MAAEQFMKIHRSLSPNANEYKKNSSLAVMKEFRAHINSLRESSCAYSDRSECCEFHSYIEFKGKYNGRIEEFVRLNKQVAEANKNLDNIEKNISALFKKHLKLRKVIAEYQKTKEEYNNFNF